MHRLATHMHAARKDSAVHVSLSSDSPVKQPGTHAVPLSSQAREPTKPLPPTRVDGRSPVSVKSFGGAPSRRAAAHRAEDLYAAPLHIVNHISEGFHQLVPSNKRDISHPTDCRCVGPSAAKLPLLKSPPLATPLRRRTLATILRRVLDIGETPERNRSGSVTRT